MVPKTNASSWNSVTTHGIALPHFGTKRSRNVASPQHLLRVDTACEHRPLLLSITSLLGLHAPGRRSNSHAHQQRAKLFTSAPGEMYQIGAR